MLCNHCKTEKTAEEFYKCSKSKCKDCYRKINNDIYQHRRENKPKKIPKPVAAFNELSDEIKQQILNDAYKISKLQISKKYGLNYKYVCDWFVLGVITLPKV